jgi:hypothetical protein
LATVTEVTAQRRSHRVVTTPCGAVAFPTEEISSVPAGLTSPALPEHPPPGAIPVLDQRASFGSSTDLLRLI